MIGHSKFIQPFIVQWESLANLLVLSIWRKKVWQINRFSQKVIIVSRNLNGFNLANQG